MNLVTLMLGAPWCAVAEDWREVRVVHALTMEDGVEGWEEQEFIAACGVENVKLFPQQHEGQRVAIHWPPRVANLAPGWKRCRACHEATGKKAPVDGWCPA